MSWSFHSPIVGNICDAPSPLVTPPGEIGLLQPDQAWLRMAHYWWLISSTDFLRPEFLSHQSISPSVTWSHLVARNLLTTIAKNFSSAACMKSSLESWNRHQLDAGPRMSQTQSEFRLPRCSKAVWWRNSVNDFMLSTDSSMLGTCCVKCETSWQRPLRSVSTGIPNGLEVENVTGNWGNLSCKVSLGSQCLILDFPTTKIQDWFVVLRF